jgi:hypothetical protein
MHPATIAVIALIFLAGLGLGAGLALIYAARLYSQSQNQLQQAQIDLCKTQGDMNKVLADINLKFAEIAQQAAQYRSSQHYAR